MSNRRRPVLLACAGITAIAALSYLPQLAQWMAKDHGLPAAPANPGLADLAWPTYNNGLDGQRFSPLQEINAGNVDRLTEVCRVRVDRATPFQAGLVMIDGVLYGTTTHKTFAFDAITCALRWEHDYEPEDKEVFPTNRGVAVKDGLVFRGTPDGRLLALEAATGKLRWKTAAGNPNVGEFLSSAPVAWQGLVFIGTAGSDWGIRGRMMAFEAATGREVWRFNTIPRGDEVGADSWQSDVAAKTGGGGMWSTYTLDTATGELLIPVGNPAPDFAPAYRPGTNLFTNSVVVLDARTGKLKWWYQLTPHDGLDRDLGAAPMVYTGSDGRQRVGAGSKDGHLHVIDRETRKLLFRTAVTTIKNEGAIPTPEGVEICPNELAGVEWNGPALDPTTRSLVVGSVDWCGIAKLEPDQLEWVPGEPYFGGDVERLGKPTGWITAVDSDTGAVRWRYHAESAVLAGVTPTAGGITFAGDHAGNLLVLDSRSGELLRKIPTGGAMAGGLITYALGGRQYVAFTSGNVSRMTFGALGKPTVVIMTLGAPAGMAREEAPDDALPDQPGGSGQAYPAAEPGAPDLARGGELYALVCAACHGEDGKAMPGADLSTLPARRNHDQTVAWIKKPTPAMPQLYPDPLGEKDVQDVAAYVLARLAAVTAAQDRAEAD
jgi:alcohol dehydrogenase (cytochrome c)